MPPTKRKQETSRKKDRKREKEKECATLNLQTSQPGKKLCFFLREREIDGERVRKIEKDGIMKKDKEDCEERNKQ